MIQYMKYFIYNFTEEISFSRSFSAQALFSNASQEMRNVACATINLSTRGNGNWAATTKKSGDGISFFNVFNVTIVDLVSMFLQSKL